MSGRCLFALTIVILCSPNVPGAEPGGLELRRIVGDGVADTGTPLPPEAIRVFVYEGGPSSVCVTDKLIGVDYGRSGVLFDRLSQMPLRRYTVADGWPEVRPAPFRPEQVSRLRRTIVGPGVLQVTRPWSPNEAKGEPEVTTSVDFRGFTWRALQPRKFLDNLMREGDFREQRKKYGSWTAILKKLNEASYVEAGPGQGGPSKRFTVEEGLAGNIATHFAVADGSLWAACVDIYDADRQQWGLGGLCRFDPGTSRWERIDSIDGRQVRWVTLLEVVGDELWVGFREGSGIAGDRIVFGMGIYPGIYRPVIESVVLARLFRGKWTTFARPPAPEDARVDVPSVSESTHTPTEMPKKLAVSGDSVLLYSETGSRRLSGNWEIKLDGRVSRLDLKTGKWRVFDAAKDLDADLLTGLISDRGEALVASNRGVHRWDNRKQSWYLLDSGSDVPNPTLSAAVEVGNELWVGYTNQSFGVLGQQGISRFDERSGRWSYISPEQIGTTCPVRRMAALPGGDVWVLFQQRPWFGAAVEFAYYPSEEYGPSGVGRCTNGEWEFPVELDGVPQAITREYRGPNGIQRWEQPAPIQHLVGLENRLFVASDAGVYVGPESWQRILEGRVLAIEASADGKALVIWREDVAPRQSDAPMAQPHQPTFLRSRYDPATGNITTEKVPVEGQDIWNISRRGDLLHWEDSERRLAGPWVKLPVAGLEDHAIGPLGDGYRRVIHKVIETSAALWLVTHGELIRVDRAQLD